MAKRAKKKSSASVAKSKKAKTVKKAKKAKKAQAKKTNDGQKAKRAVKPQSVQGTHVEFGLHGLGKIMTAVHDAKLGAALGQHLAPASVFVTVDPQYLKEIKDFVNNQPELSELAEHIRTCDCPPEDPGCVYIPG